MALCVSCDGTPSYSVDTFLLKLIVPVICVINKQWHENRTIPGEVKPEKLLLQGKFFHMVALILVDLKNPLFSTVYYQTAFVGEAYLKYASVIVGNNTACLPLH